MIDEITARSARYSLLSVYNHEISSSVPEKPHGISWSDVYSVSSRHKLSGAVFSAVSDKLSDIPTDKYEMWERECMTECARHINQLAAYTEIDKLLTEANVPHLFMKGFLIKDVWTHPENRVMSDIDVYVSEAYIDKARDVLVSAGYTEGKDSLEHLSVLKEPYVNVELHRYLYRGSRAGFSDFIKSVDNPLRYEMSPTDFLVFYIGHAEKHYRHGGCGLRFILDLEFYITKYKDVIDESELHQKLDKLGFLEFYKSIRDITDSVLRGTPISKELSDMESYIILGGNYGTESTRIYMSVKRGGKLRHFLGIMFPPYRKMKKIYPILQSCKILLPVYYVVRILCSLFNGKAKKTVKKAALADEINDKK